MRMPVTETGQGGADAGAGARATRRGRNALIVAVIAGLWLALDIATKRFFEASGAPGEVIAGPFLGLVRFKLVHNTGMAWGMFSDSTLALGFLSLAVCAVLLIYLFVLAPRASVGEAVGIALVFAGGLGNAIDRFAQGYVVDFIDLAFMDFPVFNIADIGVTCGFVIFLAAMVWGWYRPGADDGEGDGEDADPAPADAPRSDGPDGEGTR